MSGTPFTPGQLGKLQSVVSVAVATALPKAAARFNDPKAVLKALDGKGKIFAGHLESALEEAIGRMMVLVSRPLVTVSLTERHDPDAYYQIKKGLHVWGDFRERVVAKARPTEAGTTFTLAVADLGRDATDEDIEAALPTAHLFSETAACAAIAGLIAGQPHGGVGSLLTERVNLFYTSSCVVFADWHAVSREWNVSPWPRVGSRGRAGRRVFSPAS